MKTTRRLDQVKNFGPVTLPEMEAIGYYTVEQMERAGFEQVCRTWVEYFPERLNANAFLGVIATIEGIVWTKATADHRKLAKQLVTLLRREFGRPPAKTKRAGVKKISHGKKATRLGTGSLS
jgi:hypothetical protein